VYGWRVYATAEFVQILQTLPSFLWIALAFLAIAWFRPQIATLLGRLSSIKLPGGAEAQFMAAVANAAETKNIAISSTTQDRLTRRAATNAAICRGARVLWIDDNPNWIVAEKQALQVLGIHVDVAQTNQDAVQLLGQQPHDLLISDMSRAGDPQAGLKFLSELRSMQRPEPVIFYVGHVDPERGTPAYAFGITDRPDELVDYVMDILVRRRG
jgi:CheY-like chemotaxis protein